MKWAAFVFLVLFFSSCTDRKHIPSDVIPVEKMEGILWDMLLADRFTTQFIKDSITQRVDTQLFKMYHQVFAIHDVTSEEFRKSFDFYLSRPDISRSMFDSIAVRADRIRPDLYKPKE